MEKADYGCAALAYSRKLRLIKNIKRRRKALLLPLKGSGIVRLIKFMKKYLVIDRVNDGNGDQFEDVFNTLEEANKEASIQWDHLTDFEKKNRHIFVGMVEDTTEYLCEEAFEEDGVDFRCFHSCHMEEGFFDSDKA